MTELKSLESNAKALVNLAMKAGADACDVVVARGLSQRSSVRNKAVENTTRSEADTTSLRVFCGKRVASVNTNARSGLEQLAERAVAMAKVSPEDPYQGLADEADLLDATDLEAKVAGLELYDPFEPSTEVLEKMALEAEAAGLGVKGVSKSVGAGSSWGTSGFVLATSHGFTGNYLRSGFSVSASLVAGEGTAMERDYEFDSATHFEDLMQPEEIGRLAGERAVRRINPKQVKSGSFPIVCDPRISNGIVAALASAINGTSIARKTSFLKERLGKQVAPDHVTIVDDPLMVRQLGSRIFDGEGIGNEAIALVEGGKLMTWLLDSATSRELGLKTNGRASRSGSGTNPSTTNCFMAAGSVTPDEMIKSIEQGLYLNETIGHGINMVTGDYSKGASGFWIENGEITHPVAEITIAGNLAEMFMNMKPANDLAFKYGINAPTLLIEGMTTGGL